MTITRRAVLTALATILFPLGAIAQGTVSVVSAASFAPRVSPDSIATAFGTNLATGTQSGAFDANGQLTTSLLGTSIEVNGVASGLFFVSSGQINFLVPKGTQPGAATVVVKSSTAGSGSSGTVVITNTAPALFLTPDNRPDRAAILNAVTIGRDPFLVTTPEIPGTDRRTRLAIYGTGIRLGKSIAVEVTAQTGKTTSLALEYAGPAPGAPGEDQINAVLPAELDGVGILHMRVVADGLASNVGTLYLARIGSPLNLSGPAYTISTVAGTGDFGASGDGGSATSATLQLPMSMAINPAGRLHFGDWKNGRLRRFTPGGTIETFAGNGIYGDTGDGGQASQAQVRFEQGVAVGPDGSIYIGDSEDHKVRRVDSNGNISTFAGNGLPGSRGDGGPAAKARLDFPSGVAVDRAGNVYIADRGNQRIRKVTIDGNIATIAGNGFFEPLGDGGQATSATLNFPEDVAVDGAGNVFISDSSNLRIRKVGVDGIIRTFAGVGRAGVNGDGGLATAAELSYPLRIAVDADGNLLITEVGGHRLRKVTHDGIIRTIAGTGVKGFSGDGGAALQAQMNTPHNAIADAQGNLYFPDTNNRRIRRLTPVAGSALSNEPLSRATPHAARLKLDELDQTALLAHPDKPVGGTVEGGHASLNAHLYGTETPIRARSEGQAEMIGEIVLITDMTSPPAVRTSRGCTVYKGAPGSGATCHDGPIIPEPTNGGSALSNIGIRLNWAASGGPVLDQFNGGPVIIPLVVLPPGWLDTGVVFSGTINGAVITPDPKITDPLAPIKFEFKISTQPRPAFPLGPIQCIDDFSGGPCLHHRLSPGSPGSGLAGDPPNSFFDVFYGVDPLDRSSVGPHLDGVQFFWDNGLGHIQNTWTPAPGLDAGPTLIPAPPIMTTRFSIGGPAMTIPGGGFNFDVRIDPPPTTKVTFPIRPNPLLDGLPKGITFLPGETQVPLNGRAGQCPNGGATCTPQIAILEGDHIFLVPILIQPGPTPQSIRFVPPTLVGGLNGSGIVQLTGPAPSTGLDVQLKSDSQLVVVPDHLTVPGGQSSGTFPIVTKVTENLVLVGISASANGVTILGGLPVLPGTAPQAITTFDLPLSVTGGQAVQGTIAVNGNAPAGGLAIAIASSNAAVVPPATVTVPAGFNTVTFSVTTTAVTNQLSAILTATLGSSTKTATLTVLPAVSAPPTLASVSVSPASIQGGKTGTGTVTLTSAALGGGFTVTLQSGNGSLTVPASVVVAQGQTAATFNVTTTPISGPQTAVVTAAAGGVTRTFSVTLTP